MFRYLYLCVWCSVFLCVTSQRISSEDLVFCKVKCLQNENGNENENVNEKSQINADVLQNCKQKCEVTSSISEKESIYIIEDGLSIPKLHCITEDAIVVTWQPWAFTASPRLIYYIELQSNNSQYFYYTTTNSNLTFDNLMADSTYFIQMWAVHIENSTVYGPRNTDWIRTLSLNDIPKPVTNISLRDLHFVHNKFQAIVEWIPNLEQPACYYELVHFSHEDYQQIEFTEPTKPFQLLIEENEFERNFSIRIMAKSKDWENESPPVSVYFVTPSCLDVLGNLSLCAPGQPANITADETMVDIINNKKGHVTFYDITVRWSAPKFIPDYYVVTLHYLTSSMSNTQLNTTVHGNKNKAIFKRVDVGLRYLVTVVANSKGGSSEPAIVQRHLTNPQIPTSTKHLWIASVIGLTAIILFAIFGGSIYIYHRRAKRKRYERRCKYFEELEEKAPKSIDCITSGTGLIIDDTQFEFDKWEIPPERLVLQSVLGEGAFGLVRRAWMWDEKGTTSTEVAVKMLKDAPNSEQTRQFIHEIEIMKTVGPHQHLVSLIGCCTRPQPKCGANMLLVVEFCDLGDLQNYLRSIWDRMASRTEPSNLKYADLVSPTSSEGSTNLIINKLYDIDVNESEVDLKPHDLLSFARQIAVGMEFLSSMKVIHRDLAARNVLVCSDKTVKIADFGLSRDVYKENLYRKSGNGRLPIRWMAIESLTHQMYTTQSDVWSFGILLWEIVTLGGNPYPSIPTNALLKYLKSGYRMERPSNCGQELYSIMVSCWRVRAKDRPTFGELRKSLDELLESITNSKYLDLDVLTSTEFASLRAPFRDTSSLSLKSKNRSPEIISAERYVHPIMLNNAKNSSGNTEIPIIIK